MHVSWSPSTHQGIAAGKRRWRRTSLPSLLRFPLRLDGTGQHRLTPSHRLCGAATLTTRTCDKHIAASDVLSRWRCKRRVVHHVIAQTARDLLACGSRKSGGSSESDGIWSSDNFSAKPVMRKRRRRPIADTVTASRRATCCCFASDGDSGCTSSTRSSRSSTARSRFSRSSSRQLQ